MKATSKKASGLLSGLDYTAQNSNVNNNAVEIITITENTAEYSTSQHKQEENSASFYSEIPAKDSKSSGNSAESIKVNDSTAEYSERQQRTAQKAFQPYSTNQGSKTAGRTPRITIIMKDDQRKFINREARKHGLTIGEYIYGLACAASAGDISVGEYV